MTLTKEQLLAAARSSGSAGVRALRAQHDAQIASVEVGQFYYIRHIYTNEPVVARVKHINFLDNPEIVLVEYLDPFEGLVGMMYYASDLRIKRTGFEPTEPVLYWEDEPGVLVPGYVVTNGAECMCGAPGAIAWDYDGTGPNITNPDYVECGSCVRNLLSTTKTA
jgi:hypothetical protein